MKNKIQRLLLMVLSLLVTTTMWGWEITVSVNNASYGSVTPSPSSANTGQLVTLTASPNPGYILTSGNIKVIAYADANRADSRNVTLPVINTIELTQSSENENVYTFTMPDFDVEVIANFTDATDVTYATINLTESTHVFDWIEHTPAISSVTLGGVTLTAGTDYTVGTITPITNVGSSTVTITGTGKYKGTKSVDYTITRRSITTASVASFFDNNTTVFNLAEQKPSVVVTLDSHTLVIKTNTDAGDCEVTFPDDMTNVGTKTLTITGINNFKDDVSPSPSYTITPRTITAEMVSVTLPTLTGGGNYVYDGSAKTPSVTVTDGNTVLGTNDYTVTYANNVNVGTNTATVTVTGKGNYTGSVTKNFTIKESAIDNSNPATSFTVALKNSETTFYYTGSELKPEVVVTSGSNTLILNTDYTVAYENNINAYAEGVTYGTATITVTGKGNYTGTKTLNFTINPKPLTESMVVLSATSFTYTGSNQKPTVTVSDGSIMQTTDYTITNEGGTNQGTYEVRVVGQKNYTGTIVKTFTIGLRDISTATITLSTLSSYVYDGTEKRPTVTSVSLGAVTIPTSDYDVSYSTTCINAGSVTVTVTGKNNHTGSATTTFTIQPKSVTADMITLNQSIFTYNGSSQKPTVTVKDGEKLMVLNTDYTLENEGGTILGTYNVTITGINNYQSSAYVTFQITPQGASAFTISPIASVVYTGSPLTPALTVKNSENSTLTQGTHYTVAYTNNLNVGTANVIVTGIGQYSGTQSAEFSITPKPLTASMVSLSESTFTYNGETQRPTVTVEDGTALTTNDYDVANAGGINVGTYNVTVTGKGNYQGTIGASDGKTYTITQKSINGAEVTLNALDSYIYSGVAKMPTVRQVTIGTLNVPTEGYTVNYSNNTNAGTATVTLTGTGNFKDSASKTFVIERKPITADMIIFDEENFVYDGTVKKPNVTVKDGETTLILSNDYSITNPDQTEVNTYHVVITGLGNYTSTASRPYSIVGKEASTQFSVSLAYESTVFDGSEKKPGVTVTEGTTLLTNNTDYTVSYSNNINAGTATVIVTGKGHYAGTKTVTFTITPKTLTDGMVGLSSEEFVFSGVNQKPTVTVTDGTILTADDYIITNGGGINAGTYHVVVNGTRNYTGNVDKTFTIGQLDLASASVTLVSLSSYVYDSVAKEPGIQSISFSGGHTVTSDGYSAIYADNVNVGTATITLTGRGNYKGTKVVTFNILPQTITADMISLSNEEYTYNGKLQKPEVSVKCGSITLTAGVDYSLENAGGTAVGSYEVKVTGQNNYNGIATKNYTIKEQKVYDFNVTLSKESVIYNGKPQEIELVVKDGETVLKQGVQYTLVYTNNINVGTATIVITGHGDYSGTKNVSFLINPKALTEEMVKLDSLEFVYNATVRKPVVTVEDEGIITANDYIVTNSGGKDYGTYSVVITGKNNYTGTITKQFTIRQRDIAGGKVVLNELTSYVYDGKAKNPGVREVIVGNNIVPVDNYTVTTSANINVGTVTVTVTAHGNYTGTAQATFKILPKPLTDNMVSLSPTVLVYTGSLQKPVVTVTDGETTLAAQKDYNVAGDGGIEAGEYELVITGIGNYTNQVSKKFTIQLEGSSTPVPIVDDNDKEARFLFMPSGSNNDEVKVSGIVLPESAKSSTFSVTIPISYQDGDNTYRVTGIGAGAFEGMKNLRDIHLPETEKPIEIGENAIPPTTTVHVSLANLDDYALAPSLEDNFISGNVVAEVSVLNRYWTFSSGVDVQVPHGVRVFIVSERDNSTVAITELSEDQLKVGSQRVIKANNGVLFACESDETRYELIASAIRMNSGTPITTDNHRDYGTENRLIPVIEPTHFTSGSYFFMKNNEFHNIKTEDSNVKVPAGKAVLYLGTTASTRGSTLGIVGGEGTTGISFETLDDADINSGWYDMSGRRLQGMPTQKGIYIHHNKKVVIK